MELNCKSFVNQGNIGNQALKYYKSTLEALEKGVKYVQS